MMNEEPPGSVEAFTEEETVEILAASWKEKRAEIAKLQEGRRFARQMWSNVALQVKSMRSADRPSATSAIRSVIGQETAQIVQLRNVQLDRREPNLRGLQRQALQWYGVMSKKSIWCRRQVTASLILDVVER